MIPYVVLVIPQILLLLTLLNMGGHCIFWLKSEVSPQIRKFSAGKMRFFLWFNEQVQMKNYPRLFYSHFVFSHRGHQLLKKPERANIVCSLML